MRPSPRQVVTGLAAAAGISILPFTPSEAATPADLQIMPDPGMAADSMSVTALKVARCADHYGNPMDFSFSSEVLSRGDGAKILRLRDNGKFYNVVAFNATNAGSSDIVAIEEDQGNAYSLSLDIGLDGNVDVALYANEWLSSALPYESNRYSDGEPPVNARSASIFQREYHAALKAVARVCEVNATPLPPIRGRKDCPNSSLGVAELSVLYRTNAPSVVEIEATQGALGITSQCSGYMVGEGLIATARHCVGDFETDARSRSRSRSTFSPSSSLTVSWPAAFDAQGNITQVYRTKGRLLTYDGSDESRDIALIEVNPAAPNFRPLRLSTATSIDRAASVGHPLGGSWTLSSTETRPARVTRARINGSNLTFQTPQWQLDFPESCNVGPGNSGGPLLDPANNVLGTVWSMSVEDRSIFFAVPSSELLEMMGTIPSTPSTRGSSTQPVYQCPTVETLALLTPRGPQYSIDADEARCTRVR